jgi:Ca2+-binding RTX toxin-like protein
MSTIGKHAMAGLVALGLVVSMAAPATAGTLTGRTPDRPGTRQVMCQGQVADFVVGPGEDFVGTTEDDVIVVWGTDNEAWGNPGNDLICVYGPTSANDYGHTKIVAGPDHDTVYTYGGINILQGDGGNDTFYLNGFSDGVEGGDGDDHIWGNGSGGLSAYGDEGFDLIVGSPYDDFLGGDGGYDVILGNDGDDNIQGDDGNDHLFGGMGFDTIGGGANDDHCHDTNSAVHGATMSNCEHEHVTPALPLPEAG